LESKGVVSWQGLGISQQTVPEELQHFLLRFGVI